MSLDVNKIINGTPVKRIRNAFKVLEENYSEDSAKAFHDKYVNEPYEAVVECAELIFREPVYGLDYIESTVMNPSYCAFKDMEETYEKFSSYLENAKDKMDKTQREKYESAKERFEKTLETSKNSRMIAKYIRESEDSSYERNIANVMYEYVEGRKTYNDVVNVVKEASDTAKLLFTPYMISGFDLSDKRAIGNDILSYSMESSMKDDMEEWKSLVNNSLVESKLMEDVLYSESTNRDSCMSFRLIAEELSNNDIKELLNKKLTVTYESSIKDALPTTSVNHIFSMMQEAAMDNAINQDRKVSDSYKLITYEAVMNMMELEMNSSDADKEVSGYSFFKEGTLSEAYEKMGALLSEISDDTIVSEAKEEEEEDIDSILKEDEVSDPKKDKPTKDEEVKKEEKPIEDKKEKKLEKPVKPKPANLANKIQFAAMDKNAAHKRKQADKMKAKMDRKNAFNAVTKVPREAIASAKEMVRKMDEKDDERRKNYMTEPGFRKKAFKNLRLAILYGGAAYTKLSLVPITMLARHFSKEKNIRMRNELKRELETEIKICEEKINDANANEDKSEKYRLMRIRDRLQAELTRVMTNSKYV